MSRGDSFHPKSYSVVVEMENATTIQWAEVGETLRALGDQIGEREPTSTKPLVIFAHSGPESDSPRLVEGIVREAPRLPAVARLQCISVPGGRYYELKNAGAAIADGELIVILDSDAVPEPGWLRTLLDPFDHDRDLVVASGHTYLGHSGFISRMLALIWVFPLRDHDERAAERRALNANSCAFRADWLRANPFPIDNGFKVGCTKLMKIVEQSEAKFLRVPAYARHAPLSGWRFLFWRALVTGRDADRKYADMKSTSRPKRFANAVKYCFKMESRAIRRILAHRRHVAMPVWEVPAALAVGCSFYAIAFLGQLARLLGLASERPEHIPWYAQSS